MILINKNRYYYTLQQLKTETWARWCRWYTVKWIKVIDTDICPIQCLIYWLNIPVSTQPAAAHLLAPPHPPPHNLVQYILHRHEKGKERRKLSSQSIDEQSRAEQSSWRNVVVVINLLKLAPRVQQQAAVHDSRVVALLLLLFLPPFFPVSLQSDAYRNSTAPGLQCNFKASSYWWLLYGRSNFTYWIGFCSCIELELHHSLCWSQSRRRIDNWETIHSALLIIDWLTD